MFLQIIWRLFFRIRNKGRTDEIINSAAVCCYQYGPLSPHSNAFLPFHFQCYSVQTIAMWVHGKELKYQIYNYLVWIISFNQMTKCVNQLYIRVHMFMRVNGYFSRARAPPGAYRRIMKCKSLRFYVGSYLLSVQSINSEFCK